MTMNRIKQTPANIYVYYYEYLQKSLINTEGISGYIDE